MDPRAFEQQLRREGFRHVFTWRDGPDAFYADHTHPVDTAHVILQGQMTLTCGGATRTYTAGERPPDVPAGAVHAARMGPDGCYYRSARNDVLSKHEAHQKHEVILMTFAVNQSMRGRTVGSTGDAT